MEEDNKKFGIYSFTLDYANPTLNSEYLCILNILDSVIFLSTTELERATIVSKNLEPGSYIKLLSAGPESYHIL